MSYLHNKYLRILSLILLVQIYTQTLSAQVTLIDSFYIDGNTQAIVSQNLGRNGSKFLLTRGRIDRDPNIPNPNKIIVQNKYTITIPNGAYYSELIYLDDHYAYFSEFIRGDTTLDEPNKYIDGHKILSKYSIAKNGHLSLVDSVRISRGSFLMQYQGSLPSIPVLITIPMAVEGGGCNYAYDIYDSNLKLKRRLKPNLESCGLNNSIFIEDNKVHLTDQDAIDGSLISWCISDLNFDAVKSTRIKIPDNFHVFSMSVTDNLLYLMGWEKAEGIPEYNYTLVYDTDGNLIEKVSMSNLSIWQIYKEDDNLIGMPLNDNIKIWSGKNKTTKPLFSPKLYTEFIDKKIVTYKKNNNKIYIYENK